MSYAQFLGSHGGSMSPLVMREFFEEMLRVRGQVVKLWHKPTVINCPCVNPIYNTADPNCDICGGTGNTSGYTSEYDAAFVAAVFIDAEVRQDQHNKLMTKIGPVETFDGRMYCEGRWFESIYIGDHVMFKQQGQSTGTEMMIISKSPRYGSNNEIIFIKCDLEKQPARLRTEATDVRRLI